MLKIVIANDPNSKQSDLLFALNESDDLECHALNIPSHILYETAKIIQPDIYILNYGSEDYETLILVKKIRAFNPEAIVIMASSSGISTKHPIINQILLKKLPQIKNIKRLIKIHQRIQNQIKPGIKFYERKWCFYRLDMTSILYLIINLLSISSLPKANQRVFATAI